MSCKHRPHWRIAADLWGPVDAEEPGMRPCKFAEKVWNAQLAGAVGVRPWHTSAKC